MVDVRAFRGIEYDISKIGEFSKVIAPPFDVIPPAMQRQLHELHPANVVRLILPMESAFHEGALDRYQSANMYLNDWLASGILRQQEEPAVYLMSQTFDFKGEMTRWGFIATIKLEELDKGIVIPHEDTLSKPKEDRLKMLKACQANLSPVFTCYFDNDGKVKEVFNGIAESAPQMEMEFEDLGLIRVWRVTEQSRLNVLHDVMNDMQLFIADGHHRYESALNYRNLMREKYPQIKDAPWERVMVYMTDFEDPALLALPIHRAIKHLKGLTVSEFLRSLSEVFELEPLPINWGEKRKNWIDDILKEMRERGGNHIGMILRGLSQPYLIKALPYAVEEMYDVPEPLRELDIIQLHRLALADILEIREKDLRDGEVIIYDHDPQAVGEKVVHDNWSAAFFLNKLQVSQIRRVCLAGLRMHQKSTYFYPKLPTGVVFHRLR
jgi:uncharacterized protein (DUF1015 family)